VFPISALGNFIVPGGVTVGASLYAGIVYSDILAYRAAAVFTLIRVLRIMVGQSPQLVEQTSVDASPWRHAELGEVTL
jgi:hypothetical protein